MLSVCGFLLVSYFPLVCMAVDGHMTRLTSTYLFCPHSYPMYLNSSAYLVLYSWHARNIRQDRKNQSRNNCTRHMTEAIDTTSMFAFIIDFRAQRNVITTSVCVHLTH